MSEHNGVVRWKIAEVGTINEILARTGKNKTGGGEGTKRIKQSGGMKSAP